MATKAKAKAVLLLDVDHNKFFLALMARHVLALR